MSTTALVELGKTQLREAKMVVHTESGESETTWVNAEGQTIAWCWGVPALCSNSPDKRKLRCVHFGFHWKLMLNRPTWCISGDEVDANEQLEAWLNQQPLVARECVSLGQFMTLGTWDRGKNRWFWGPKQNRQ